MSRRGGQRRLVFLDSWTDEAGSSETHNKPFSPQSAGAGLLRAAVPKKHTGHKVVGVVLQILNHADEIRTCWSVIM